MSMISLKTYDHGLPAKYDFDRPQKIVRVANLGDAVIEAIQNTHGYQGIVKVAYKNKIYNIITNPEIARKIGEYYRENEQDSSNPFKINLSFFAKKILGDHTIITSQAHGNEKLREILGTFMRGIDNNKLFEICYVTAKSKALEWKSQPTDSEGFSTIKIKEEISMMVSKIGIMEILGFSEQSSQVIAQAIVDLFKSGWSNWINNAIGAYSLYHSISKEVDQHLTNESNNPLFNGLKSYASEIQAQNPKKSIRSIIISNYYVILFAFQKTTSSLISNILLKMGAFLQQNHIYQELAENIVRLFEKGDEKWGSRLKEFKNVVDEGLRLFSPGIIERDAKNLVIKDNYLNNKHATVVKEGEVLFYTAFIASKFSQAFGSPKTFNPDRFANRAEKVANDSLYHFGLLKHRCLGQVFALRKTEMLLACLIAFCEFKNPKEEPLHFIIDPVLETVENPDLKVKIQTDL